jgi:hypothetical protein
MRGSNTSLRVGPVLRTAESKSDKSTSANFLWLVGSRHRGVGALPGRRADHRVRVWSVS